MGILKTLWDVAASLAILGGVVQFFWYAGKLPDWVYARVGRVSWGLVETATTKIIEQLRADAWHPDWIIGIGRTGNLVSSLIAENMRWLPPDTCIGVVNVRHDLVNGARQRTVVETGVAQLVINKKVLLVDSEMFEGDTARMVRQVLSANAPKEIRLAVVFKFEPRGYKLSETKPDYIGQRLGRPVLMPWLFTIQGKIIGKTTSESRWGQ